MKILSIPRILGLLVVALCAIIAMSNAQSLQPPSTPSSPMYKLSLEEIAAGRDVASVSKLLNERQLKVTRQSNDVMKAQGFRELEQSKAFGAAGRLWVTFEIGTEPARVHVSFYYDDQGDIVGRGIIVENLNVP